jgi:hypothetical protein
MMRFKLESLLSALTSFAAVAYALGWLKSFYFYRAFGVNLDLAGLSTQDYLFESWFVLENVVFFLILWWVVLKAPTWWAICLGGAYSLIPIAAHYAFARPEWTGAAALISSRHTLLKFVPFALLAFRYFCGGRTVRASLQTATWPYGQAALGLCLAIAVAWAVSTAKHFGSFDALQYMAAPDEYFSSVRVRAGADLQGWDESQTFYFLRKTDSNYLLLDLRRLRDEHRIGLVVLPLDHLRVLKGFVRHQVQPGNRWF